MSISKLFLSKDDDGFLLTRNEFAEADFAEHWRYERIRGVLSVMTPTGEEHTDTWEPIRDHLVIYKTKIPITFIASSRKHGSPLTTSPIALPTSPFISKAVMAASHSGFPS